MSLDHVPLSVRLGDSHITREVAAVAFRKEAVGGVRNIRLRLARPLDRVDQVTAYTRVRLYDSRSAEVVAEGRLTDLGRSAGADGQQWDEVAFGPLQHASDKTVPYIVIDQTLTEGWRQVDRATRGATVGVSQKPDMTADSDPDAIVVQFPQGLDVTTNSRGVWRYDAIRQASQKLGGFHYNWDTGITDANYQAQAVTRTDGGTGENAGSDNANTAGGSRQVVVVTDFTNGRNTVEVRLFRSGGAATIANDTTWASFDSILIRALLLNSSGAEVTTGYTTAYVLAHTVVNDMLGRFLGEQYDGPGATVDTTAAHQIQKCAYPDGATPAQVLDDMMALEPAHYWTTGPSNSAGKYAFEWKVWPTTVRYEITLEGGGQFPASGQELFNRATVRWVDSHGRVRNTPRTGACPNLDNATPPIVRRARIDLGDEIGSLANAERVGDNFLADHKYPANAGKLTVDRPIRDLVTGAMVRPHEIVPGELIRVRGIESYPDALNASSSDGQTVFRIWTLEYNSDTDSAVLELDTYSRTTANAIANINRRRTRKR